MKDIKRYRFAVENAEEYMTEVNNGSIVRYEDHAAMVAAKDERIASLQEQVRVLAAENSELKNSRAVLAENALETCNAVASAGFRNEAIMRGLMESTGNLNKYPKPITTLVDEALRKIETPASDAALREIRAQAVEGFVEFNRKLAKDYPMAMVAKALEVTELNGEQYAARIRAGEQP